ncbi:MAG: TIGR00730 family Rossman fold protein [Burkholderiaceae bacterium]
MTRPDNQNQKDSPSYRLPALDESFLLGESMRGVRFLLEYAKADEFLRHAGVESTVVVFGSARLREGKHHDAALNEPPPSVAGTARNSHRAAYLYEQARQLGRIVSERGGALRLQDGLRHNVIATGGGPGIMEAANRGATEAGAPSIGLNITLPHEQEPNPWTTPALTFRFHYFAMRKMHLAMRAKALVVFPGGFGTLDELFELLTLRQTNKVTELPIVLFDGAYWRRIINFDALVEEGMVSPADLGLFAYADDAEEAWQQLLRLGLRVPGDATSR